MKFALVILAGIGTILLNTVYGCAPGNITPIGMAVEYNDHAACAYIAEKQGWYEEAGLELSTIESYTTGMALAASLTRGDIQVAYICLVPAISACANAGVPLKIVSGTHQYGYGLAVNPKVIKTIEDLAKPGVRIGCVREGGSVDLILLKTIEKYNLDKDLVLANVQRMNPPKQVLAVSLEQLDAAFLPEHWATMCEEYGFTMILESRDVWPGLQGSVLAVKEELLDSSPDTVERLVRVTQRGIDWINLNRESSAELLANSLTLSEHDVFPADLPETAAMLAVTPEVLLRSMDRLAYTSEINPQVVQDIIDFMADNGYIKEKINAEDMLDLRFMK